MEVVKIEKIGRFTIVKVKETLMGLSSDKKCNGKTYTGIGIARCSDTDKYDKNIAERIATGRAVNALEMKKRGKEIHSILMG